MRNSSRSARLIAIDIRPSSRSRVHPTTATNVSSRRTTEVSILAPPRRARTIRLLNTAGRALARVGYQPISLRPERLLETAARRAGLDDYGDERFLEPLELLLRACREEGRLNLLGSMIVQAETLRTLQNRLRLLDVRRRSPELADQRIREPVFIVGLPRTGTSILHELMALDPENRAPLTWEVLSPVPRPEAESFETDPRIAEADRQLSQTDRIVPDFKKMHRMGARLPQECCMLLNHDFMSMQFHVSYRVPSYQDWFDRQDLRPAYAFHRWQLQYLQSGVPTEHWVLKSPQHLWTLGDLLEAYPDARIVFTHRDPVSTAASVASLCCLLRSMCSDRIDPHEIGADWAERIATALERSLKVRQQDTHPKGRFFDMHFHEYLADPIAMLQRIYAWLGRKLSVEAEARMRGYLAAHPQGQHGRHRYSPADYGIDADAMHARLSPYQRYFDVPSEQRAES